MIASQLPLRWTVRLFAPVVWRSNNHIASKLLGFSATEAGSALDMLRAAELETNPRLRRQFFQHAVDEARHAALFRTAAATIETSGDVVRPAYASVHATRQNLYETLGRTRFLAFVHLAEREGQSHFAELARYFEHHPTHGSQLGPLFAEIEKDERFHVSYSAKNLEKLRQQGIESEVRRAVFGVRWTRAREAWRRAGRHLGDIVTRIGLTALFFIALPTFALAQALFEPERTGWKKPADPQNAATGPAPVDAALVLTRLRRSF